MHRPEEAKRLIVGVCAATIALPVIAIGVLLLVGWYAAVAILVPILALVVVGVVVNGRRSWQKYLAGPPGQS